MTCVVAAFARRDILQHFKQLPGGEPLNILARLDRRNL